MFSRIVAIVAMLSIAVVTMVTSAHSAQMNVGSNDAVHTIELMQAHGSGDQLCDATEPCGSAVAGLCGFVCAGLSVYLLLPAEDAGRRAGSGRVELPSVITLPSRTPGLSERPPKIRLL
jgi:hypothetical protein